LKKKYSAIYEHNVFTVNIYFFMRIRLIDDDNEVKLLLKNIMHLWYWIFSISILIFDYHYHKEVQVISIWRAHHSNHTTNSGHNNATFRKSYILSFLTFFFLFFSELYSFSFFCFWVLMYMYNMLLRFEKKNNILPYTNTMCLPWIYISLWE
jgi:hypothetical protein